jgi:DNA invertase Pin-like site-specific DNA recombinase
LGTRFSRSERDFLSHNPCARIVRIIEQRRKRSVPAGRVLRLAHQDLKNVATATRKVDAARAGLRDKIYAASLSGESIRDIAKYAGLSPTRVHELLKEARRLARED